MDINPTFIFNVVVGLVIVGIFIALVVRSKPTEETNIFEYGQLLLQAHESAKIIVQGIQEAWRTGEIADDERETDAIEELAMLFPQLNEDDLRRIVKSAVYLLRQAAGKEVNKIMDQLPTAES